MYSYKNQYPVTDLPHRLIQADGGTVTDIISLDNESLIEIGFVEVDNPPEFSENTHKLEWSGTEWQLQELTEQEIKIRKEELSQKIRLERDEYFDLMYWRVERYQSEIRLGLTPSQDIVKLDNFFQSLRDITKQETFPYVIDWPNLDVVDPIEEDSGSSTTAPEPGDEEN